MESLPLKPLGVNVNLIVPRAAAIDSLAPSISLMDAPWSARCDVQDADPAPVYSTGVPAGWIPKLKAVLPPTSSGRTMLRPCPAA
jgi:hypothetical protein